MTADEQDSDVMAKVLVGLLKAQLEASKTQGALRQAILHLASGRTDAAVTDVLQNLSDDRMHEELGVAIEALGRLRDHELPASGQ